AHPPNGIRRIERAPPRPLAPLDKILRNKAPNNKQRSH
ncbi:MAG: hypothetical protein ACI802_003430, partial [Candidatus Paceibacteria bacterium]